MAAPPFTFEDCRAYALQHDLDNLYAAVAFLGAANVRAHFSAPMHRSPLHAAIAGRLSSALDVKHCVECCVFLVQHVALPVDSLDEKKETPLLRFLHRRAACDEAVAPAEALLRLGANPNYVSGYNTTPLRRAIEIGDLRNVRVLLRHGASIDLNTRGGDNVFHLAVRSAVEHREVGILELLLHHGRNNLAPAVLETLLTPELCSDTPLCIALRMEQQDAIRLLSQQPGVVGVADILSACAYNSLKTFRNVLESSAVDITSFAFAVLEAAIECKEEDVLRYLVLERKLSPLSRDPATQCTALHKAAGSNWRAGMVVFIEQAQHDDLDVNVTDPKGNTPLHSAAAADAKECVLLLLEFGADLAVKNNFEETPLDVSASTDVDVMFDMHQQKKSLSTLHTQAIQWLWINQMGGNEFEQHIRSTYLVTTNGSKGTAIGVDYRGQRFVLTCAHVVNGYTQIQLRDAEGRSYSFAPGAFICHPNPSVDVAIARDPGIPHAYFRVRTDDVRLGQAVQALGYPLDYDSLSALFTSCSIGGVRNRGTDAAPVRHIMLTGGGINPGNSGGPLIVRSPDNKIVWVAGLVARAPDRFPADILAKISEWCTSRDPNLQAMGNIISLSRHVGIAEVVAAVHLEELLNLAAPIQV